MTTNSFDLARVAWQARDHMHQAAADMRAARSSLLEVEQNMQWRSKAAERFSARAEQVVGSTEGVSRRCETASDTLLTIENYLATL